MDKFKNGTHVQKTEALWSNKHFTELNENLQRLFEDQQFCDITLISADGKYKIMAHKIVLASVSEYFLAMFGGSLSESEANEVKLSQIDGASLKLILDFIYKGLIEITIDTVESVLVASNILGLSGLEELCCAYMKKHLDSSNCLGISNLAKLHNFDDLYKAAVLCACENFAALMNEDEFLLQSLEQLCELISSDDLRMASEGDVFHGIMSWINYEKDNRKQFLDKLISYVRFPLLSPSFIAKIIRKESDSHEMLRTICNALTWHAVPDMRSTIFTHEQSKIRNFKDVIVAISGFENSEKDLSVGLYYSGLGEWIHTKWPAIPYARRSFEYIILGDRLLIAGDAWGKNFSNRVDCLNLRTLEWTDFPHLTISEVNSLLKINNTLYALDYNSFIKLEEPFEKWTTIEVSDISVFEDSMVFFNFENLIYFTYDCHYCTYNPVENAFNMKKIKQKHTEPVFGAHIISHSYSDFLVEAIRSRVITYDLETSACVLDYTISLDMKNMKTALHGENLIIYGENKFYEYNVFKNQLRALPHLDNATVDILLTNNGIC